MSHLQSCSILALAATLGACQGKVDNPDNTDASVARTDSGSGTSDSSTNTNRFQVEPQDDQTISVDAGQSTPTLDFAATLDGNPIVVTWSVDRAEIGTVPTDPGETTVFTPSGSVGGIVTVKARLAAMVLERKVMVTLRSEQNGPSGSPAEQEQIADDAGGLTAGGGIGGVGGEGLGVPVVDGSTLDALDNPVGDGAAQGLTFLYPYDGTVWPRGLLAPLLQWDWSAGDADAVKIELETTSGSFAYSGTFGRPAILAQTGGNFIRHPIPQDAWTMATNTAGETALDGTRDRLTVRLTVARGGEAYGPITQTYTIAPARLAGTIYYQSYGTQLAKNYSGAVGGDGMFGGAILSIKVGDLGPQLAAGASGHWSNCRVCHAVAANGSRLVAEGGTSASFSYTITPGMITQQAMVSDASYPAMTPDGLYALNPAGQLLYLDNAGAPVPVTGLSGVSTDLGTPAFSPAGDKIVFNPMNSTGGINSPTRSIAVMDYDPFTFAFSNVVEVVDNSLEPAETRPGWPAFFPDGNAIVYQQQTVAGFDGNSPGDLRTRHGAKGYLAWTHADGTGTPTPLSQANGASYLPRLANPIAMSCTGGGAQVGDIDADHADDVNLNYEPTVNPIASGGYAWVVFTSRRMYGHVADIPPFCSDPRGVDLIQNITPKKLWVAAVDLEPTAGSDPSHPAFYLPAQELLAGNARGFWVLDPCRPDGETCETGDQCCNGFCSQSSGQPGDPLVCASEPGAECSMTQEACIENADCCDPDNLCINNFCTLVIIE